MKKKLKQLLALVLTLAVVMGFALPAAAADPGPRVTIEKVSNDAVTAEPEMHTAETKEDTPQYADTDMVRVSITLAGASTIDAGYATRSIANNAAADIYRTGLKVQQQAMAQRISQDVLGGEALDVVWNMTLLTNTISANVPYGKIEAIEALDGVASVTLENRYEPCRRPQTGGRRGNHRYGEAYPQRRYSHHGTSRTDAPIHQQVWNIYGPCQG